jgi:hypothetical protein
MLKALTGRYQKFSGTSENSSDEQLRTRYYKANFNQIFQTVEELLRSEPSAKITSVSKEHGEISAELSNGIQSFLTVTVVTTKPFETAVDMHISTEKFALTGVNSALKRKLVHFYQKLDKAHTYIGSGIHGNE